MRVDQHIRENIEKLKAQRKLVLEGHQDSSSRAALEELNAEIKRLEESIAGKQSAN